MLIYKSCQTKKKSFAQLTASSFLVLYKISFFLSNILAKKHGIKTPCFYQNALILQHKIVKNSSVKIQYPKGTIMKRKRTRGR